MTTAHHPGSPNSTLVTMLVIAALLHGLFILGVGFELPTPPPPTTQRSLDVILVPPQKAPQKPQEADLLLL
jgi:hypothetical protein